MPDKQPKQLSPMTVIWFFSLLSAVAGCGVAMLSTIEDYQGIAYMATGLAHLIVLVPSLQITGVRTRVFVCSSLLCALFPLWGFIIGLACVGTWSILACSFIWGLVLMVSLRRPVAVVVMLLGGLAANLAWVFSDSFSDFDPLYEPFEQLASAYTAWYVLMFFAMPLIMYFKPAPRYKGGNVCPACGYSLEGLDAQPVCPECGTVRAA